MNKLNTLDGKIAKKHKNQHAAAVISRTRRHITSSTIKMFHIEKQTKNNGESTSTKWFVTETVHDVGPSI